MGDESLRVRHMPIVAVFLVPIGVILTIIDWLFDFLPDGVSIALSICTVVACVMWAWWLQRRGSRLGLAGRHRKSPPPEG
jgi:hypothetical protein